jgi:choline dehydrogenase
MAPANVLSPKLFFNPVMRKLFRVVINVAFSVKKLESFVNNLYGIVVILGKPLSTGSVKLASSKVKDPALVDPAYYTDPADMETMLNAAEWVKKMVADEGMKAWGSKPVIPAMRSSKRDTIARWIYGATMTTFHYCGTCMMGKDIDKPVDLNLKLKGFSNVRIADASVMPEIPVSALNAPSMMIGYRAADLIINNQ